MTDEYNPYRDDVYWPMEQIRKADMAAARGRSAMGGTEDCGLVHVKSGSVLARGM